MASTELRARLRKPFPVDKVYTRKGPGGKQLDYVAGETFLNRLLDETADEEFGYAWQVTHQQVFQTDDGWAVVVAGQLSIGGDVGSGTGAMTNKDLDMAAKSANTEAIKNAAKNGFGIGLELWDAEYRDGLAQRRRAAAGNEQALKALVFQMAADKLGRKPKSAAEVAEALGVSVGDLSDADSLAKLLEDVV
jgi:hypothetical protein